MKARYLDLNHSGRRAKLDIGNDDAGFRCVHCHQFVPGGWLVSGVRHRNHCPYCLHSRHMDLLRPGDRLAACKSKMQPVALTNKLSRKRYRPAAGELMVVHCCCDCGKISLNRIAADDDGDAILALLPQPSFAEAGGLGFQPLTMADLASVHQRLFGKRRL